MGNDSCFRAFFYRPVALADDATERVALAARVGTDGVSNGLRTAAWTEPGGTGHGLVAAQLSDRAALEEDLRREEAAMRAERELLLDTCTDAGLQLDGASGDDSGLSPEQREDALLLRVLERDGNKGGRLLVHARNVAFLQQKLAILDNEIAVAQHDAHQLDLTAGAVRHLARREQLIGSLTDTAVHDTVPDAVAAAVSRTSDHEEQLQRIRHTAQVSQPSLLVPDPLTTLRAVLRMPPRAAVMPPAGESYAAPSRQHDVVTWAPRRGDANARLLRA